MKKNFYFNLTIIVLLFASTLMQIIIWKSKESKIKSLSGQLEYNIQEVSKLNYVDTCELISENWLLDKNIYMLNENGDSVLLANIINQNIFVYRLFGDFCYPCIENDIGILKQLGEDIGTDQIIILTDYDTNNKLKILKMKFSLKFDIFSYKHTIDIPVENYFNMTPYFLIIQDDFRTRFVRLTDPANQYSFPYFKIIKAYLEIPHKLSH